MGRLWPGNAAGAKLFSEFVKSALMKITCSHMKWESFYVTGWSGTWGSAF